MPVAERDDWHNWRAGDRVAVVPGPGATDRGVSGRRGTLNRAPWTSRVQGHVDHVVVTVVWDDDALDSVLSGCVCYDVSTLRRLREQEVLQRALLEAADGVGGARRAWSALLEAAQREREGRRKALAEMRRLELEDRHTHRALVLALLHKRALLASGKLRVDTSRQGVPAMASPTRHEKEVLVRVVWQQKPAAQPGSEPEQPEPEPEPEGGAEDVAEIRRKVRSKSYRSLSIKRVLPGGVAERGNGTRVVLAGSE